MKTLYIIGNGFDRYHGLDTRYQAFGMFLQENYSTIYDYLIEYYGLPDLDPDDEDSLYDPLWAEFEAALADLDFDTVLENNTDYLANPYDPDFRDRDWHSYQIEMERIVDDLTTNLFSAFKHFILNVSFPEYIDNKLFLDKEALFLNFNYTDTIEKYYSIPSNNILYIHKKAKNPDDVLILGHGINPTNFVPSDPQPPAGANEEELADWHDSMADNYDYSYESGKAQLLEYFSKSFKETSKVIKENKEFFQKIKDVDQVIVLGHSLSEVDKPYLKIVKNSHKNNKAIWTVSYYGDKERDSHLIRLNNLGLSLGQINLITMDSLKLNP